MANCTGDVFVEVIDRSECIGNSLIKINSNFAALDGELCKIQNEVNALPSTIALANLSGDIVSYNRTTQYNNVVPSTLGGAGGVPAGLLKTDGHGVVSKALSGVDYMTLTNVLSTITASAYVTVVPSVRGGAGNVQGILKADGTGIVTAAVSGVDYIDPSSFAFSVNSAVSLSGDITSNGNTTTYSRIVPNNKGGAGSVAAGILKTDGSGVVSRAVPDTDYVIPSTLTTSINSNIALSGDIISTGNTTKYNNKVPPEKGGAGTLSGMLKAKAGTVSAADPDLDYMTPTGTVTLIAKTLSDTNINGSSSSSISSKRTLFSVATPSIANKATASVTITNAYKGYILYKITVSEAAWVRIYVSESHRSQDANRAQTTDPLPSAGVVAELIAAAAQTSIVVPGIIGFNNENTPVNSIPIAVTNLSGKTAAISVGLTIVQIES